MHYLSLLHFQLAEIACQRTRDLQVSVLVISAVRIVCLVHLWSKLDPGGRI